MITFDVNVMVAAFRTDHPFHGPAKKWLETAISQAQGKSPLQAPTPWQRDSRCLDRGRSENQTIQLGNFRSGLQTLFTTH